MIRTGKRVKEEKSGNRVFLKGGAMTAPIPPAIVTVGEGEEANALTVAWTGILATVPPKTYISVRPSRHSYGILKETGEFVINLPSADMAKKVDYIGIYTGAKVKKFEKCGLTKLQSKEVKAPTVAECPIALECRVTDVLPMGSHDVFVADILSVSADGRLIDEEGKIHFERADLLAYAHGEYYSLGEIVGRFGFSTDKEGKGSDKKTAHAPAKKVQSKAENKDKTAKNAEGSGERRPFYLDLPRSVRKTASAGRRRKK